MQSKHELRELQSLEVERIILQKENVQLKATIDYMNKTYGQSNSTGSVSRIGGVSPDVIQREKVLQLKEKELQDYQSLVDDKLRKLEVMQKIGDLEARNPKSSEYNYQPVISPRQHHRNSPGPGDDYGIKGATIVRHAQNHQNPRLPRNHNICTPQTQEIIEKVRMRQQARENSCDGQSRASRRS